MTNTTAAPKFTPMQFARVLRIMQRGNCSDLRKVRRASCVALRWTDANRSPGWDVAEYHAQRRRVIRQNYGYTVRALRNARAALGVQR